MKVKISEKDLSRMIRESVKRNRSLIEQTHGGQSPREAGLDPAVSGQSAGAPGGYRGSPGISRRAHRTRLLPDFLEYYNLPEGRDEPREIESIKTHMSSRISEIGTPANSGWSGTFSEIKTVLNRSLSQCVTQQPETCIGSRENPGPLVFVGAALDSKSVNPSSQQQQSFWDKVDSEYEEDTARESETPASTDGKLPTPREVQLDPDAPVPMDYEQAVQLAGEKSALHLAVPGGDPNARDENSLLMPTTTGGNAVILQSLASAIDSAVQRARNLTIRRIATPQVYTSFMEDLDFNVSNLPEWQARGAMPDTRQGDTFKDDYWDPVVMTRTQNIVRDKEVYTFSNVLRRYSDLPDVQTGGTFVEGSPLTTASRSNPARQLWFHQTYDDQYVYCGDPGTEEYTRCLERGSRDGYRFFRYVPDEGANTFENMFDEIKSEAESIGSGIAASFDIGDMVDPEFEFGGAMLWAFIIINTPRYVKEVITGESTVAEVGENIFTTMSHEFDHLVYISFWGSEAITQLEAGSHGIQHATADVAADVFTWSARELVADRFDDLADKILGTSHDSQSVIDRRFQKATSFIDMNMWENPMYAYQNLISFGATPSNVIMAGDTAQAIENYVYRLPAGAVPEFEPGNDDGIQSGLQGQVDWDDEGNVYIFGDAESDEELRNKSRKVDAGELRSTAGLGGTSWIRNRQESGEGLQSTMHYLDPRNPHTRTEIDARVLNTKLSKRQGAGSSLGLNPNTEFTLDELKTFADATNSQLESAGFSYNARQLARLLKPGDQLDQESVDNFNSVSPGLENIDIEDLQERLISTPRTIFTEVEIRKLVRRSILRNLH